MQKITKPLLAFTIVTVMVLIIAATPRKKDTPKIATPKIQVAVLLDVSNSMDGLIEQAKAQLWNMVNTLGSAKCNGVAPAIEIALYEYGRTNNDVKNGYVKQINGFITSLDSLSENLFKLTTNGGDEYCGQVIYNSVNELQWDANKENYKVIFIAGNEDFLQGNLKYTEACNKAKEKGIIVNTIYCGDKMQGIREHWNLNAECGDGSYSNINSNAKMEDIPTPYDSTMMVLNSRLNSTYIAYGNSGAMYFAKQAKMDEVNVSMSKSVGLKRTAAKAKSNAYRNDDWDLVDAMEKNSKALETLDFKNLPDTLQRKSKEEVTALVKQKATERAFIQGEINTMNTKREAYLVEERKRRAANTNEPTLETEMNKVLKLQAKKFNIVIE